MSPPAALRAHLLPHINSGQTAPGQNGSSDNKTIGSASPDMNIDPAISGAGASAPQTTQVHQQQQQSQQAAPPNVHGQTQQQMQTPQSTNSQNLQMSVSPVMSQGMAIDQNSGAEDTNSESQPKQRGGKRELSTSKRAAQNRAAQRAFRQRKEGYIKKLEEQVRDFSAMQESYKQIQAENYQLRDYIISLQSRVIESQGEDALPPPPVSLVHPAPPIVAVDPSIGVPSPQATPQTQPVSQQQHVRAQAHVQQSQQPIAVVAAPTANMGMAPQPQVSNQPVTTDLSTRQKRPHNESEALLQSIAQAAGHTPSAATAGNGFMSQTTPSRKSNSPATKRVKGEQGEQTKTESSVNGA
ncbi:hypothetical protein EDC01DRAFT_227554 [Geopyxis carbonaria]|nr:hypothetical protein EDC01DRAFT_227554 [Geopyxis carbonaria]